MKRTYAYALLTLLLVVGMSGCGKKNDSANIVAATTPVTNTLGTSFDPNSNIFLNNNCPGCVYTPGATNCASTTGIFTPNGTCITNPGIPNFGMNQNVLSMYSNAAYVCGNNPLVDPYMMQSSYFNSNPYGFIAPCQNFGNYYPTHQFYTSPYQYGYDPYTYGASYYDPYYYYYGSGYGYY